MSSVATTPGADADGRVPNGRSGLPQLVRSEWTKLWSLRSTGWTLLAMLATTVGFAALICWGTADSADQIPEAERVMFDSTAISLAGLAFGQLAAAVLGVLIIASEYSTGAIRSTLVAVPRRLRLLAAKAVVLLAVVLVVGTLTSFTAFLVGQALLAPAGLDTSLDEPGVLRAVFGGGLYLTASALFGYALGTLLRQTAGSIVAAVAGLLVVAPLTMLLPGSWGQSVSKWFTSNAGQQITAVQQSGDVASPWAGYLAFVLWGAVILAVGMVLTKRRDA